MSFTILLNHIKTRIDGSAAFWVERDLPAITEVIPWEGLGNYDEDRDDPQPPRPYLAVDFGDLPRTNTMGFKEGRMEFDLVVVVDNFHRGRSRSADRDGYLEVLAYPGAVEALFEGYQDIRVNTFRKPSYQGNICVHRLSCSWHIMESITRAPWTVTV